MYLFRRFWQRLRFELARLRYEKASKVLANSGVVDERMLAEDEITIVTDGSEHGADKKA
jgi:hypothetical protein